MTRAGRRTGEPAPRAKSPAPAPGRLRERTVRRWALVTARITVAAGLAVDAYVHLDLAPVYAKIGGPVNEGVLFRVEASIALLTAIVVLFTGRRISYLAGFAVGFSALAVMLASRYVDLGAIGPLPDLYDPVWFPEKLLAAFAEGAASVMAVLGFMLCGMLRKVSAAVVPRSPSL